MSESPLGSTISSRRFIYGYLSYTLRVEFAHKSVVCQKFVLLKIAQGLLRVYNPRVSPQSILLEKVTKKEGKTNRQKFRATNRRSRRVCDRIKPDPTG